MSLESFPECFIEYENNKGASLPNYLKRLLSLSGYDNPQSISAIDDTDLLQIEEFARHTLPSILPDQNSAKPEEYYGIFSSKPDQFKFVPGHVRLLKDLCSYFKLKSLGNTRPCADGGTVSFDDEAIEHKKKKTRKAPLLCEQKNESSIRQRSTEAVQDASINDISSGLKLREENLLIRETVKHWLKERVTEQQWTTYYEMKFNEIKFNAFLDDQNPSQKIFSCKISCYCKKIYLIRKYAKSATRRPRWIYSNFEGHLKMHVFNYHKETRKETGSPTRNRARNSLITNFFVNVADNKTSQDIRALDNPALPAIYPSETYQSDDIENDVLIISNENASEVITTKSMNDTVSNTSLGSLKTTKSNVNIIQNITLKSSSPELSGSRSQCGFDYQHPDEKSLRNDIKGEETRPYDEPYEDYSANIVGNSGVISDISVVSAVADTNIAKNIVQWVPDIQHSKEQSVASTSFSNSIPSAALQESHRSNRQILGSSTTIGQRSKWKHEKYQRSARKQRCRQRQNTDQDAQTLLTDFFPLVERFFSERPEKYDEFIRNLSFRNGVDGSDTSDANNDEKLPYLLTVFQKIVSKNISHTSNLNSYDDEVKWFCIYMFYTGGRLLYETFQKNLPNVIPSISTLNRFLDKHRTRISEGYFDFEGLAIYLKARNLPPYVWIGEDATRITGKIEYDEKSNKIIGFVLPQKDGVPNNNEFYATSADIIEKYFLEREKSSYAYVIMAQPLSAICPAYCLAIFGTNNKFTYKDVLSRWSYIENNARKFGVFVLGKSSDGDTRLLKAMRIESCLGNNFSNGEKQLYTADKVDETLDETESTAENLKDLDCSDNFKYVEKNWPFYQMTLDYSSPCVLQDQVHIGTKLRTRLLNPHAELVIGDFVASASHLRLLIETKPKDLHLLTLSDIKSEDKMNFASAERMCNPVVFSALQNMAETKGTQLYLRVMNLVLSSTLDETLDVKTRVYNIWFAVFVLRIWRNWLKSQPNLSIQKNFLSLNCYLCIELNAHTLIKLILLFRENEDLSPEMFQPWLFGSQSCEKLFRAIRSLTATYSTVVNVSLRGILQRMDRINALNGIVTELKDHFVFPREERMRTSMTADASIKDISPTDLEDVLRNALSDALVETEILGIANTNTLDDFPLMSIHCLAEQYDNSVPGIQREKQLENHEDLEDPQESEIDQSIADLSSLTDQLPFDLTETIEEMNVAESNPNKQGHQKGLYLKDYSKKIKNVVKSSLESSPYVKLILSENDSRIIKKSALCWLLDENQGRVSADRLRRFFTEKDSRQKQRPSKRSAGKAIGSTSESLSKKAKRGRPKKIQLETLPSSETESSHPENSDTDFEDLCSDHSSDDIYSESDHSAELCNQNVEAKVPKFQQPSPRAHPTKPQPQHEYVLRRKTSSGHYVNQITLFLLQHGSNYNGDQP